MCHYLCKWMTWSNHSQEGWYTGYSIWSLAMIAEYLHCNPRILPVSMWKEWVYCDWHGCHRDIQIQLPNSNDVCNIWLGLCTQSRLRCSSMIVWWRAQNLCLVEVPSPVMIRYRFSYGSMWWAFKNCWQESWKVEQLFQDQKWCWWLWGCSYWEWKSQLTEHMYCTK